MYNIIISNVVKIVNNKIVFLTYPCFVIKINIVNKSYLVF